ncbi:complex 1 protein (LYR family) protein [Sporothrix brasiliensis 5110]|uniref:Complex 1 protein (LYR family) protein n=1 Tax=Sporothrix brasiliensis 5110 TaxID=1398154 RepID=A0A0C2J1B2_9PEZI|nr:complex 1 protein (LYR family) protein [Sporothrix brasiliensis 5110]KIH90912.1 complex 1 protein (LYR family) protein [Sporothrix brasiliensis 5110]
MRLSGLQREVLSLYRQCLRASRQKPEASRAHFEAYARSEFAKNKGLGKKDFAAIEFLLRKGRRQLDAMSSPGITDVR